jgi:fucose 4-O-acetylase-like acetyltransferase
MKETKRLYDVELIRSLAIIFVVTYHCFAPYFIFPVFNVPINDSLRFIFLELSSFRMPLFVFLSGYLFSYLYIMKNKYQDSQDFVIKKFKRLIIPYVIFYILFHFTANSIGNHKPEGHLWFIRMLFMEFIFIRCIIIPILQKTKKNYIYLFLLIFFFIIKYSIYHHECYGFVQQFIQYLPYFYLGYLTIYFLTKQSQFPTNKIGILIASIAIICCNIILYYDTIDDRFSSKLSVLVFKDLLSISTIYWFFSITNRYLSFISKHSNIWGKINKSSYGIYVFHHWLIFLILGNEMILKHINNFAQIHYIIFPFILLITIFIISYLITQILLKTKVGRFLIG